MTPHKDERPGATGRPEHTPETRRPEEIDERILRDEEKERKLSEGAVERAEQLGFELRHARSGYLLRAGSRTLHVACIHALGEVLGAADEARRAVARLRHQVAFVGTGMHRCIGCDSLKPHGPGWLVQLFEALPSESTTVRPATPYAICATCADDPAARAHARGRTAMLARESAGCGSHA
jgi:hypothetical protein